jgi:hypothetical protein
VTHELDLHQGQGLDGLDSQGLEEVTAAGCRILVTIEVDDGFKDSLSHSHLPRLISGIVVTDRPVPAAANLRNLRIELRVVVLGRCRSVWAWLGIGGNYVVDAANDHAVLLNSVDACGSNLTSVEDLVCYGVRR